MTAKEIVVDAKKCAGCRVCELICSFNKHDEFNPKRSRIRIVKMDRLNADIPILCKKCSNPSCIKSCPENAMVIGNIGEIQIDEKSCIGCKKCLESCSIGAISIDPVTNSAIVCDLCGGDPVCVKWCPTGALTCSPPDLIAQSK